MIPRVDTESERLTQTTSDLYFYMSIPPSPKKKISKTVHLRKEKVKKISKSLLSCLDKAIKILSETEKMIRAVYVERQGPSYIAQIKN